MMTQAFADAIKNTFNLGGRTNRRGFWLYVSAHSAVLAALFGIERAMNFRLPAWEWRAYFVLAGIPFLALFLRRWHDISSSAWEGVGGAVAIPLFYCFNLDPLIGVVLLYFLVRLSQPSAEDNRYGPKPVDRLTTRPETPPSWKSSGVRIFQLATIVACVVWINNPRMTLGVFITRHSPGLNRMSDTNAWVKSSLEKRRNIAMSSIFAADGKEEEALRNANDAHILFLPPHMPAENVACPAYPPEFLKKLDIRSASYEGLYRLVAVDASGIVAVRILASGLFCKRHLWQSCLKFDEAVLLAGMEDGTDAQNPRACYRPALKRIEPN